MLPSGLNRKANDESGHNLQDEGCVYAVDSRVSIGVSGDRAGQEFQEPCADLKHQRGVH